MTRVSWMMGWVLLVGLGCSNEQSPVCGAGELVEVSADRFCAYPAGLVIEGGFECPDEFPVFVELPGGGGACAEEGFDPSSELPMDVCLAAGPGACGTPSDAGVMSGDTCDEITDLDTCIANTECRPISGTDVTDMLPGGEPCWRLDAAGGTVILYECVDASTPAGPPAIAYSINPADGRCYMNGESRSGPGWASCSDSMPQCP